MTGFGCVVTGVCSAVTGVSCVMTGLGCVVTVDIANWRFSKCKGVSFDFLYMMIHLIMC